MNLPMPELPDYVAGTGRFYVYVWDTTGVPEVQEVEDAYGKPMTIITPQTGRLVIYGEQLMADDHWEAKQLAEHGRILGYWFSPLCPDGEAGTVPADVCQPISRTEFSAAYTRGWEQEGGKDAERRQEPEPD